MSDFIQPFDLVRAAVRQSPARYAIIDPKVKITYGQLYTLGTTLGQVMRRRGVGDGDVIGLNLPAAWRCVASVAISHEAAVAVPYSPAVRDDVAIGMKWVITDRELDGVPLDSQFVLDKAMLARLSSVKVTATARSYPSADTLYRIAMSSGTTGTPKAIPLSVAQNHLRALESIGRWAPEGRFMSFMGPKNGVGWHAWHTSLVRQQPYIVPIDAMSNLKILAAAQIESVMGSPSHLAMFARALAKTNVKLPALRHIQSGGSRLPSTLIEELRRLTGLEVGNTYSSTEFGAVAYRLGQSEDPSYMGQIVDNIEFEIVDSETNEPVSPGEFGLLRLRRPEMVNRYLNDEAATASQFKDGWFYPGDIAKVVDGGLYLGARDSEMINAGGQKVDPVAIDEVILSKPEVIDAATFGVRDELGIENIAFAFVAKPGTDSEMMWKGLRADLADKTPTRMFEVDAIPRNEWGKPLRRELTERFSATPKN